MLVPIGESVATLPCNDDLSRVKAREGMFQLRLRRFLLRHEQEPPASMVHDDGPRKPHASRGVYERPTPGCLRKSARLSQPCLPESSSGFPERSAPLLLTPGCGTQSGPLHLSHQLRIAVHRRPSRPRTNSDIRLFFSEATTEKEC
jgi:hypothetical protein